MPKEQTTWKRRSKEKWTREKEARNRSGSPTPKLQCRSQLTDGEEETEEKRGRADEGDDGALLFTLWMENYSVYS
ncbi:hypothetical protein GJ744_002294 [Endocarpon pusillum]|uniref:Uncharacterized protein n=1 Tax=Endocarpon pusillum TaxID=364733 RepID=A0A8H7AQ09_9EURO|nr:hypothetical protein GJ744_002294 [Endocarpon pusillum]